MKLTKTEREKIKNIFGGKCAYCGKELGDKFHIDHIREGEDVKDNLVPVCARCNLQKGSSSLEHFRDYAALINYLNTKKVEEILKKLQEKA
ncbi:HNH endonuclease [Treponema putidum]|uniref:HNH endonuclease n=1 Tax=Treponema putidum TaxID=221027 RepID=UPI0021081A2F|nr:HNH endonuclease signature motif containing protein [Treponema putidum]UTY30503.1 HNH endonuclease [Treponema putidum]